MRTPALLLTALVATGCTAIPTADDLELQEQEQRWGPSYTAIPEATHEPVQAPPTLDREAERVVGQPWVEVGRYRWNVDYDTGEYDDLGDSAMCPFETTASGFPAVTIEGDLVVESVAETVSASDGEDEDMLVTWHDVDADSVDHWVSIYDGGNGWYDSSYHRHCRALWKEAKAQAQVVNRRLAERTWRALEPLGIFIHDPESYDYEPDVRDEIMATPGRRRPAELTYGGHRAIVRVPGVEVLSRTAVDWWGSDDDDFCDPEPHVRQVWGDRETGAVAVALDHQSGGCLCYTPTYTHTLRWSDEVFAAADREADSLDDAAS